MQPLPSAPPSHLTPESVDMLRRNAGWVIALGVVLIVLGLAAIHYAVLATLFKMIMFGLFLVMGGVAEVVQAVASRRLIGFVIPPIGLPSVRRLAPRNPVFGSPAGPRIRFSLPGRRFP